MQVVEGRTEIEDVDAFVERLGAVGEAHDCAVAAFDARYVVGRQHLETAVALANRAHRRDDAIARNRGVEILLYAAGTRQIDEALELGVSRGDCPVVVVVDGDAGGGDEAGAVAEVEPMLTAASVLGDVDEALVRDHFEVGDAELAATAGDLGDLVCERVALLVVEK
ncbi:KEOPS complex subunit Cgi121 [Halobacteriales archaeon Cl-PHB]